MEEIPTQPGEGDGKRPQNTELPEFGSRIGGYGMRAPRPGRRYPHHRR